MESVVFQKTVIILNQHSIMESRQNMNIGLLHFMNGLLNQQTKSFFR